MIQQEIPREVGSAEILVRVIFHPLFYSKSGGELKTNAFLPPREKTDVSIYRLDYSDAHACKRQARKIEIPNQAYCGMAVVSNNSLQTVNQQSKSLSFEAKGTPLDEDNAYRAIDDTAYTTDPGSPMHADIVYSEPLRKGVPDTHFQEAAKEILERTKYYPDNDLSREEWTSGELLAPELRIIEGLEDAA